MLEDARSIRDAMWRMAQPAQDATERWTPGSGYARS
jgi:hypothetical protein